MRSKVNRWRTFENRQAIDARLICSSDWTPGVSNTILKFSFSENISFLPLWGDVGVRRSTQHPAITFACDGLIFRQKETYLSFMADAIKQVHNKEYRPVSGAYPLGNEVGGLILIYCKEDGSVLDAVYDKDDGYA